MHKIKWHFITASCGKLHTLSPHIIVGQKICDIDRNCATLREIGDLSAANFHANQFNNRRVPTRAHIAWTHLLFWYQIQVKMNVVVTWKMKLAYLCSRNKANLAFAYQRYTSQCRDHYSFEIVFLPNTPKIDLRVHAKRNYSQIDNREWLLYTAKNRCKISLVAIRFTFGYSIRLQIRITGGLTNYNPCRADDITRICFNWTREFVTEFFKYDISPEFAKPESSAT